MSGPIPPFSCAIIFDSCEIFLFRTLLSALFNHGDPIRAGWIEFGQIHYFEQCRHAVSTKPFKNQEKADVKVYAK